MRSFSRDLRARTRSRPAAGSRSRTCSTPPGSSPRTARSCSPTTCRPRVRRPSAARRPRAGSTSARPAWTSSPTGRPLRTRISAPFPTRSRRVVWPGGRAAAPRPRLQPGWRMPRRRKVDVPFPEGLAAVFMREAADVHRELFEEHADAYGENVRVKVELCLAVTDSEYERALAGRDRYREQLPEAARGVDLLLSPTLTCVEPRAGHGEHA